MQKRPTAAVIMATAVLLLADPVFAGSLRHERQQFLAAERALAHGAMDEFARLEKQLRDYPLHPYLRYGALKKQLSISDSTKVRDFIEQYSDTPLAWRLRNNWLNMLATKGEWKTFLAFYQPSKSAVRTCDYLKALINTGKRDEAMPQVVKVWLHGKSQPRNCDRVFDVWTKAGHRTKKLVWQRIGKAIAARQPRLANYLSRSLSPHDQAWVERWIELFKNPALAGEHERFTSAHPYRETMLAQAIRRLARRNGVRAMRMWQDIKPRYRFSEAQTQRTERYIVRNLVRIPGEAVYDFIRGVDVDDTDTKVLEARIRAALLREDWPQVAQWIDALPRPLRENERWRYWLARAHDALGASDKAKALFADVARERTYYGFMAADRIGVEYRLYHADTPATATLVDKISKMSAIERAREFFALERWTDARREWRVATKGLDTAHLKAAAKLAKQHGWHDRAIFTLAKTGYWDDLELRFPLQHAELVERNAEQHGIDIAWVFAVMRQESAFMSNVRSHAGAMGLMQLMPATARSVARDVLKRKPPRRSELFEPDTNIALGSAYLKQMKGELGNSAVLATAAYNAGPHRVTRWLPKRTLPADIWIELVPFQETRGYLRRVLAYTVIYEKRMGRKPKRLRERLHPVAPTISQMDRAQSVSAG